jgi:cellulose synthase/poly-beta-1,6-N-acetylglucosamine synthase-like glycosyltransferase
VAPFMGHNAFLRWKALQDAAFVDPEDGKRKIWSENNVSEDFDMALRLILRGYIVRYVSHVFLFCFEIMNIFCHLQMGDLLERRL